MIWVPEERNKYNQDTIAKRSFRKSVHYMITIIIRRSRIAERK